MKRDRPPSDTARAGMPASVAILVALAAAIVVLAALSYSREVVGPVLLAATIVIICHPVRRPLVTRGWPSWAATTVAILLVYIVLAALAASLLYAGLEFTKLLQEVGPQLQSSAEAVQEQLRDMGVEQTGAGAVSSLLQPDVIATVAASLGGTLLDLMLAFLLVLAYVIFMSVDGARYATAGRAFGRAIRPTLDRVSAFTHGVRTYYVVNASFGVAVAIVDGLALWLLQIPAPIVWAILAFVTNFIPNIGFVLGVIPPAVLALIVGGWPLMLAVLAIYCVVNVTLQVLIQPKFVADAVDLSLTLSFFSVIFWTFVIGPLGAILSIPLTLAVRALLLDGDPHSWWVRWLSGDRTAEPPDSS